MIFVPALGERTDQSSDAVARRIRTAMDRADPDPAAVYVTEPLARHEPYGAEREHTTSVHTVSKKSGENHVPIIDVFDMCYAAEVAQRFETRSQLGKGLNMLLTTCLCAIRFSGALLPRRRKSVTPAEKLQLALGMGVLALLASYTGLLVVAIVDTLVHTVASPSHPSFGFWQQIGAGLVAIGVVAPGQLRRALRDVAVDYSAAVRYFDAGDGREARTGQLTDLVDHVLASGYKEVQVIAYSFGSIIAIDTLFPRGGHRAPRLDGVSKLITIGCPYDAVRVYWPGYFGGRGARQLDWQNVYSLLDVLSSNFKDQPKKAEDSAPEQGDSPAPTELLEYVQGAGGEKLTLLRILLFTGLRAHGMYWDRDYASDVGCFGLFAAGLSPATPAHRRNADNGHLSNIAPLKTAAHN
ncbi:MAG TPA: hypothetical protein VGQ42_05220 [Candidatus Dormibacteraeota bacterium]|nr:hypothetical protein [Candidatus Dormibacteraeota bacterium]